MTTFVSCSEMMLMLAHKLYQGYCMVAHIYYTHIMHSPVPRPPRPAFVTCTNLKLGVEAWERGYIMHVLMTFC